MPRSLLRFVLLLTALTSCDWFDLTPRRNRPGEPQREPLNLQAINSEFDDYNSALPRNQTGTVPMVFSSKRAQKTRFNLVYEMLAIGYDAKARTLTATNRPYGGLDIVEEFNHLPYLVKGANGDGSFNVLGPQYLSVERDLDQHNHRSEFVLLYADDREGNLNIRFTHNFGNKFAPQAPQPIAFLNSPADDAYPTFTSDYREIYFTSNRDGQFDIYRAVLPAGNGLLTALGTSEGVRIEKVPELSSPADDKCPYILGNRLVFVSNRPGGRGGFDIYASEWVNGTWTTPANAGSRLNTPHDEYRPALTNQYMHSFTYPVVVFSSNRPGGKGGFDLYLAGLLGD